MITSRLARFAWIAARLHGVASTSAPDWAQEHVGARVSARKFQQSVGPIRPETPLKGQRGPRGRRKLVRTTPVLEDWLLVDEPALGLIVVLYRLPNDGMPQPELLNALDRLTGLRQVVETSMNRDVFAIGLVRTFEEARDLRSRIEDLAPGRSVAMDLIETESGRPARGTWLSLARRELADSKDAARP